MTMLASEAIREARTLLFERGWCQRSFGTGTGGPYCIHGALHHVVIRERHKEWFDMKEDVHAALRLALDGEIGITWQDRDGRTFDEVIDALERAEKFALIAEEAAA